MPLLISSCIVSIHAPARGATHHLRSHRRCGRSFNPRSREGSDPQVDDGPLHFGRFQSTLPRGERRWEITYYFAGSSFQSTLPRGERPVSTLRCVALRCVSIHAPARGATYRRIYSSVGRICFNPRSREGSDEGVIGPAFGVGQFQSTLPRGERHRNHDWPCR